MIPENRSTLVHLLSEVTDLTRALGEFLLPPAIGHGLEQRDQGHRRGNQDPALDRRFDQARIGLRSGAEEGLAGNEQDGERGRRRELFLVRLRRQFGYVPTDMACITPPFHRLYENSGAREALRGWPYSEGARGGSGTMQHKNKHRSNRSLWVIY